MAKVYTKTGDQGETGVLGGRRLSKSEPLFEVIGGLDELNSLLGLIRALAVGLQHQELDLLIRNLRLIQGDLFAINALLAGSKDKVDLNSRLRRIESQIDALDHELELLTGFIYPTGHPVAAQLFVARAVCRRVERNQVKYVKLSPKPKLSFRGEITVYLNRLADYLFVLARWVNLKLGIREEEWKLPPSSGKK